MIVFESTSTWIPSPPINEAVSVNATENGLFVALGSPEDEKCIPSEALASKGVKSVDISFWYLPTYKNALNTLGTCAELASNAATGSCTNKIPAAVSR